MVPLLGVPCKPLLGCEARRHGLKEFQAVTTRVAAVEPPITRKSVVELDLVPRLREAIGQLIQQLDADRRVRFLRGAEVHFDAKVELDRFRTEPDSTSRSQLKRLGKFSQAQSVTVEDPGSILLTGRHCKLHVVDRDEFHGVGGKRD